MSNFICTECGMTNIDCGYAGYKTPKEIELERKLTIAVKALDFYKKATHSEPYVSRIATETLKKMEEVATETIKERRNNVKD